MKVWEEAWEYYAPNGFAGFFAKHVGKQHRGSLFEGTDDTEDERARARLAAAAPELARVLLAVEFDAHGGFCPSCRGLGYHKPECTLDAALRKAGVR